MSDPKPFEATASDLWGDFTDSAFSEHHLTPKQVKIRQQSQLLTFANITKMYLGVAFISGSKSVS